MNDNPFECYLATLRWQMKWMPQARREEQLQETLQHLESMLASHLSTGMAREKAIVLTLREFGPAELIAGEVNRVYLRSRIAFTLRWVSHALAMWVVLTTIQFAFFSSMNDKPTDFPYQLVDRLKLSMLLATLAFFGGHFGGRVRSRFKRVI